MHNKDGQRDEEERERESEGLKHLGEGSLHIEDELREMNVYVGEREGDKEEERKR